MFRYKKLKLQYQDENMLIGLHPKTKVIKVNAELKIPSFETK